MGDSHTDLPRKQKATTKNTKSNVFKKSDFAVLANIIYEGERNKASSFRLVRFVVVVVVVVLGGCLYWDKVEMEYYLGTDLTPHGYCMGTKIRWSNLGEQICTGTKLRWSIV